MQGNKGLGLRIFLFLLAVINLYALEPVLPIKEVKLNYEKAILGKMLFFDKSLSLDKKTACVSCHSPKFGGADNKPVSIGVFGRVDGPMNSPTVYNAVFNCWQFWNGRAKDLQEQAAMAFVDEKEMGMTPKKIEKVVNSNSKYKLLFKKIYKKKYITFEMVCNAIAEFEKALITPNSRFDKYLKGDKNALSVKEKRGYILFKAYGCITCHNGVNFGGNSFQKVGIFIENIDLIRGRDRFEVTHNPMDKYVYKVPTLRNIALTGPYLHDGSEDSLKKVIILMGKWNLGIKIPKKDVSDIEAFLLTLTGEKPKILDDIK